MYQIMNGMKTKFKAFTIIELMVVSALTVITASAAFSAIGIFDNLFENFQEDAGNEIQLLAFKQQMSSDFKNSNVASIADQLVILEMDSIAIGYRFEEKKVTRLILEPMMLLDSLVYSNINIQTQYKHDLVDEQIIDHLHVQFMGSRKTSLCPLIFKL